MQEAKERSGASGRVPADAPGGAENAPRPGDWDDAALDRFWLGVYSRLERGIGWTILSASAALLLGYAGWHFVTGFLRDVDAPVAVRIGTAGVVVGLLLLLLGFVRERVRAFRHDPFRRVRR